jgi:mannosyltransferase OCH1-like enzyme
MIPKIIHIIWWQGINKIPSKFKNNINSWREKNPKYKMIIWDETTIMKFINKSYDNAFIKINLYNKMIQKIDYAKYLIIYKYGGCYVDIDMLCYDELDNYLIQDKINVSVFYFTKIRILPLINNGFIACDKKNNTILDIIKMCNKYVNNDYLIDELTILKTTGPLLFNSILVNSDDVHILDWDIIYESNIQEYGLNKNKGKLACHFHEFSWINGNILLLIKLYVFLNNNIDKIIIITMIILFVYLNYLPNRLFL